MTALADIASKSMLYRFGRTGTSPFIRRSPNLHSQGRTPGGLRPSQQNECQNGNVMGNVIWSSGVFKSRDLDEFAGMIRPDGCEILVTERGSFDARGMLIDLCGLYAQRCRERLGRLIEVDMSCSGMIFLTEPGPSMFLSGAEIRYENVALFSSGNTYVSRLSGPASWGSLAFADDALEISSRSHFGRSATWVNGCAVITPPPAALTYLRSLHAAAGDLAEAVPGWSVRSSAERGLKQALLQRIVECSGTADVHADSTARQHHRFIIRRFREILEAHSLEPLLMPDISRAIGVSSRTLRMACQRQFGVSPTQYLLLRRMRLARRTLRFADPAITRVTDVATDLGFWELGRFAVKYRQIFGETPSATLRAAAGLASSGSMPLGYAFASI
jgi:AraC-like DNA-binding protein